MRLTPFLLPLCLSVGLSAAGAETWELEVHRVPMDDSSPTDPLAYTPLERAAQPWQLCILYPHLKDAYWLSVNYGMAEEAKRLGVGFTLYEAGGYPNLARQIEQAEACAASGADALVVGTVSYDGLTTVLRRIAADMPVIATVNDIAPEGISAKSSVPWREMGAAAGRVLAVRHPKGSAPVDVAWFPGPKGAGWVRFVEEGFLGAIADSSARVVAVKHGDTGREDQVLLIEEVLDEAGFPDYLVGSGPMAEAAVSILRARGHEGTGIVSDYMTHAVHRGIRRGKILAAPSDFPVMQGRLAVELAVRAIEGSLVVRHAGPRIVTVTAENAALYGVENTLAPADFAPVFSAAPP